jgi:16S rRNA (cytidine1402-2'-O)-methyltransferase
MDQKKRTLYLIPSTLGDTPPEMVLPAQNLEIIRSLVHFVVEEEKTARRFLIRCGYNKPLNDIRFFTLNEHTDVSLVPGIFDASKVSLGLISEAGVPAVADPGAALVEEAHRQRIHVVPMVGPSSLVLALMASGLNGQSFAFNGYLPVKDPERVNKIRFIEKRSAQENQSQLFIEAPYRNQKLIKSLLETCRPQTKLCIAANLTLENEYVVTKIIGEWRIGPPPDLNRQPTVFILQA